MCVIISRLCFKFTPIDPEEITSILEWSPSGMHKMGERSPENRLVSNNFWATELVRRKTRDVGLVVSEAVNIMSAKADKITAIASHDNVESYLGVTVSYESELPFINISTRDLAKLAGLALDLDVDLFPQGSL